jgi:hypothetical protein
VNRSQVFDVRNRLQANNNSDLDADVKAAIIADMCNMKVCSLFLVCLRVGEHRNFRRVSIKKN